MATVAGCTPHGGCSRMQRPHLSKVGPRPVGIVWVGEGAWNATGDGGEQTWGDPGNHWEFTPVHHWVAGVPAFTTPVCCPCAVTWETWGEGGKCARSELLPSPPTPAFALRWSGWS